MSNPADLASFVNDYIAEPSSWRRVADSLRPNTAVGLAGGWYDRLSLTVPGVVLHALDPGTTIVTDEVSLDAEDAEIQGLHVDGPILLGADGTRARRTTSKGITFNGANQVAERADVSGFQSVGISATGKATNSLVDLCHVHDQVPGGKKGTLAMMMIGHSHADSDKPINIRIKRTLVEKSLSHDGIEIKSSGAQIDDCTVLGCDLMQRHGIVGMIARSCWVEGGDIQLNSNNGQAIRCHTGQGRKVRVTGGTGSCEELLHKKKGQRSIYPWAADCQVHNHDGLVVVGWVRPQWKGSKPPLRTLVANCPNVQDVSGARHGQATPIPDDQLPPAPRKLTPADVGPHAPLTPADRRP